jgi:hypothetical protein
MCLGSRCDTQGRRIAIMNKAMKAGLLLAGILVVIAASALLVTRPRTYVVDGTITYVNVELHQAGMQFRNPLNMHQKDKTLTVPSQCRITLNGQPARLADLRVGDQALAKVWWRKLTQELRLLEVEANRPVATTAPAAATQPAGGAL